MKLIYPENIARPGGHYSPGVISQGLLFVSGQLPILPTGDKCLGPIEEQTEVVLQNLESILLAAGASKEQVVKVTIYLSDVDHWGIVNALYSKFFAEHRPARAIVPVSNLHYGFLIEVEAIAEVNNL